MGDLSWGRMANVVAAIEGDRAAKAEYSRRRMRPDYKPRVPKMTPEQVALAKSMYESGEHRVVDIAKAVGKDKSAISKRATRDGWRPMEATRLLEVAEYMRAGIPKGICARELGITANTVTRYVAMLK